MDNPTLTVVPRPGQRRSRGRKQRTDTVTQKKLAHARNGHRVLDLPPAPEPAWDSRKQNIIGPVKDQSQCGSCWDFSGVCVVEVANYKAGVLKADGSQALSEEYVLSCLQNGGCSGDDNTTVLIAAKAQGLPFTSDYGPYDAGNGNPGACRYQPTMHLTTITDWGFADGGQGSGVTPIQDIKEAIKAFGCVGAAIAADDAFESFGNGTAPGAVFAGSGSTAIDHDIVLIGWDDAKQAWLMRNSWGIDWGEQGYIWIAYGANLVGTEAVWGSVAGGPTPPGVYKPPFNLFEGTMSEPVPVGPPAGYPDQATATTAAQGIANADGKAVMIHDATGAMAATIQPAGPTPPPPGPTPGPTPSGAPPYAGTATGVIQMMGYSIPVTLSVSLSPVQAGHAPHHLVRPCAAGVGDYMTVLGDVMAVIGAFGAGDGVALLAAFERLATDLGIPAEAIKALKHRR